MKKLIIATVFLAFPVPSEAEVYNCNGVYTNNPCSPKTGAVPTSIPSKEIELSKSESADKRILSKKKFLTHELAMKISKVNREYKLSYSVTPVEEFCLEPDTGITECSEKIDAMNEKIDDRVTSLETLKAQKKANELQEQKLKQDAKDSDVTIIRQVWVVTPTWAPRPPYQRPPYQRPPHWRDDDHGRPPLNPRPIEVPAAKPRISTGGLQER